MIRLQEHVSSNYGPRTFINAKDADWTIAIAVDYTTHGEVLTQKAAGDRFLQCPFHTDVLENARALFRRCVRYQVRALNVAGNGIYTFGQEGISQEQVNQYVYDLLKPVHAHHGLHLIRSGGQTGVDIAAAVAACKLDIEARILFPYGYKQRDINKRDFLNHPRDLMAWIKQAATLLKE